MQHHADVDGVARPHGIARDHHLALVLDKAQRHIERHSVADIHGGLRHSASGDLLHAPFEIVVSGIERIIHAPACGKREFFRVEVDEDGYHLVVKRQLRYDESESACADYDQEVAFARFEAVEDVVAEGDIFREDGFVVGNAVRERVYVLRRH